MLVNLPQELANLGNLVVDRHPARSRRNGVPFAAGQERTSGVTASTGACAVGTTSPRLVTTRRKRGRMRYPASDAGRRPRAASPLEVRAIQAAHHSAHMRFELPAS